MAPRDVIVTSLLLGAFVAAGGAYGILLCISYASARSFWLRAARSAYVMQCAIALTVLLATPLDWWWKALIIACDVAYYFVPPLTWRYLIQLHHATEGSSR